MLMFTSLEFGLFALVNFAQGLAVTPTPTSSRFSNSTTPISSGSLSTTTEACCFIVLDTIYENWWQEISTSTYYDVVNLTSITTLITPYPTVTSTNYETNVYTTNATFYFDVDVGYDPITLYTNNAPGPKQTSTLLNANGTLGGVNQQLTAVTTGGTTVYSPQAFWAYSTVRIITAEAVTDPSGNKVCGTTSAFQSIFPVYSLSTLGYTSSIYPILTSILESTTTYADEPIFTGINSNVNSYFLTNQTATQTGVVISLTTPFVYAPTRGATLVSGEPEGCKQGPGTENYGYPVQTLLDYLVKNPAYSSQYPGLENCLPGGPAIIQLRSCSAVAPYYEIPGGDLTSSTVIIVTPTGVTAQPESVATPTTASPTQVAPTSTEQIVSLPPSTSPSVVPSTQIGTPSLSLLNSPTPSPNTPESQSTSTSANAPEASSPPASPNSLSPASSSAAAIASAIASRIGATLITGTPTVISGMSEIIVSGETTIPVNPAVPLPGSTTVIGGVTNVIVSSATTVPISHLVANLPGSTTLVSGTLNVVLGTGASPTTIPVNSNIPGLSGSTFISSSGGQTQTFVVVSTPETVPVVLGVPTQSIAASGGAVGSGSGSANSTVPLQFTSAGVLTRFVGVHTNVVISMLCGIVVSGIGIVF